MKSCIIDASSAILLFKSDLISDLVECYDTHMSPAVYREVTITGYPGCERFSELFTQGLVAVSEIPENGGADMDCARISGGLGHGERETISLYEHGIGDFVIIDDRKGAIWCRSHNIPYINALLVPRILLFAGVLNRDRMKMASAEIISVGRYSSGIISFADSASDGQLRYFFP